MEKTEARPQAFIAVIMAFTTIAVGALTPLVMMAVGRFIDQLVFGPSDGIPTGASCTVGLFSMVLSLAPLAISLCLGVRVAIGLIRRHPAISIACLLLNISPLVAALIIGLVEKSA